MKKILNALFLTLLAVLTFSSCSDVPSPYDIKGEGDIPGLTGDGTKENPYNIEAAQKKQDGSVAWVQGYIVGAIENIYDENNQFAGNKANFTGPFTIATNVLIAESPDETNESKCLPVKVKGGSDLSNALNLKDHPENKGEILLIQGELNAGFGKAALINTVAAVFNNKEIGEEQGGGGETGNTTITENQAYEVSFASDLAGFTVENKVKEGLTGDVWYYSKKYTAATASSYNGTGNVPAEGLFISPVLDMTAISKATLTFEHSSYSQGNSEELMLKAREANATEWTDLTISNYSTSRDNRVTTTVDLTSFAQKKAQIAFHYKNEASGSNNTWYIYNLKVAAGEGGGTVDPDPNPDPIEGKLIFTEKFGSDTEANILGSSTSITSFTHWDNAYTYTSTEADIRAIAHRTPDNTTESKKINNIWFPKGKDADFTISGINTAGYTKFVVAYEAASNAYSATEVDNLNNLKLTLNGQEVTPASKEIVGNGKVSGIFHEMQVEITVAGTDASTLKFSISGADNKFGIRLYNIRLYATAGSGEDPGPGPGPEPTNTYESNIPLPSADNSTDKYYKCSVKIAEDTYDAFKLGKSKAGGAWTTSAIGAGKTKLSFYSVAWKGQTVKLTVTIENGGSFEGGESSQTVTLVPNDEVGGTLTTFPISPIVDNFYSFNLTGITAGSTINFQTDKERAVVFGVQAN